MPRKSIILDTKVSNSTTISKNSIYAQTKDKIFGGYQLQLPEGTPLIDLLKILNEEQLYRLNLKICEKYYKELQLRAQKEGDAAEELRISKQLTSLRNECIVEQASESEQMPMKNTANGTNEA